jgi:phospholipid/cholesterol/gamma-HCH transport system ATP-binding protein
MTAPADAPGDPRAVPHPDPDADAVVQMQGIVTCFGKQVVHDGLDLTVRRGEILAIAGGSRSGTSVLLREMIGLQRPTAGTVRLFGTDLATLDADGWQALRQRWGVMFQKGGLLSALTVRENVGLPLREHRRLTGGTGQLDDALIDGIAAWKLSLTGLPPDVVGKMPDAPSGGMLKRAALARALALGPELLILDEPTSGLDPASAAGIGKLITSAQTQCGRTIVIISHDLELLWRVPDRVVVLGEGRVLAIGPIPTLVGAFVLLLGAALVAGVLWLAAGVDGGKPTAPYQSIFTESVAGLNLDAPVKYLGVDVGKVKRIAIDPDNPRQVLLGLQIEQGSPECPAGEHDDHRAGQRGPHLHQTEYPAGRRQPAPQTQRRKACTAATVRAGSSSCGT